jgi:MinD-like ATPase involved in chromosome partitioning or flagellar assembly
MTQKAIPQYLTETLLPSLPQYLTETLLPSLQRDDPEAKIEVQRTSIGWIILRVITTLFQGKDPLEREEFVESLFESLFPEPLSLFSYPISHYDLWTPEEAKAPSRPPTQLPLWSELLMAPEPYQRASSDTSELPLTRPLIVTFYSFKGGVGRTTALGIVARMLAAANHRVVMLDFDLEAPGLSFMFSSGGSDSPPYGVIDYLHQRYLTPDKDIPSIEECIRSLEIPNRGELFLISAGEYTENYVHRLADLDMRLFYRREKNPLNQLIDDITNYLNMPDILLIDARTGFNEIGAVALLDLADIGIICFSPTEQSFAGLDWVLQAAKKQYDYQGKPDLRFLLTPIPPVEPSQQDRWIRQAEDYITDKWGIPETLSVAELHTDIPYNPAIATLGNLDTEIPDSIFAPYTPLLEVISSSLPEKPYIPGASEGSTSETRETLLKELTFSSATAQEIPPADLPAIFQKTDDFPKFLQRNTWLVRGAKGTGKSLLFRLFVEQLDYARTLAPPESHLQHVTVIPGHGREEVRPTILSNDDMQGYHNQSEELSWRSFWRYYALIQLITAIPECHSCVQTDQELEVFSKTIAPTHKEIVSWIIQRIQDPFAASQVGDALRAIDQWLKSQDRTVWLIYDELDRILPEETTRNDALQELFSWWIDSATSFQQIVPKMLIREDIWQTLHFPNKAHFAGRNVQLRWEESDIWRLVLRQALASPTYAKLVYDKYAVTRETLDRIELPRLRECLFPLWGERMGRGKKAYTYNWVRNRMTDGNKNWFPRIIMVLLQKAIEREQSYVESHSYEGILRPKALIEALPSASEIRVNEVREEYPEIAPYLDSFKQQYSPLDLLDLQKLWGLEKTVLTDTTNIIDKMIKAGILREYTLGNPTDTPRYAVTDLYLYGLQMKRKGQQ